TIDAEVVRHARLGTHPVFDGQYGEGSPPRLARGRIDAGRARGAETGPEVVYANDEEPVGIHRLARTHHVVPPPDIAGIVPGHARHVMRSIQRMADQHRIAE